MCRVSARWCSTSCPGASFYCKRKPPRSIGYGRTRRETRRSADESVGDTSRSETRHAGHDSHSHFPPIRPSYVRPPSSEPQSESYEEEAGDTSLGGLRSPRDLHGQSPMMGGRNRSNRRSFVRVILNSPPRHASFRPRTFPRVSPTTRVALAGDGAGGGCVCVSVRDDLIITVLPPSASVSATTSPHRHTRVTLVSSGTAREGGTRDEEVG